MERFPRPSSHPIENTPETLDANHQIEKEPRLLPVLTAYVLRHGETTEDKLNPNRGLTENGEIQTDAAAERLMKELDPDRDIIQILDSGNYRAETTVMRIAKKLKQAGFVFFKPIKVDKGNINQTEHGRIRASFEPSSRKHKKMEAATLSDELKKELANPKLHESLQLPPDIKDKRIAAWYGLAELGQIPDGAETPEQVTKRVEAGIADSARFIPMLSKQLGKDRRLVAIIAGNATAVDTTVAKTTGIKAVDRGGEIENCEGFKVDFRKDDEPAITVWGEKIEEVAKK